MTEPVSISVLREDAEILGITIDAPMEEIKVAYERFKRKFSSPEYVRSTEFV